MLNFMWLKFTVVWRCFRLWALLDGVESPENIRRCVNNNYDIEGFWKNWHSSFNRWLVRLSPPLLRPSLLPQDIPPAQGSCAPPSPRGGLRDFRTCKGKGRGSLGPRRPGRLFVRFEMPGGMRQIYISTGVSLRVSLRMSSSDLALARVDNSA